MTSATYEAGISGLKYTVIIDHALFPDEKYPHNFQNLFDQFPGETTDRRTFNETQAANITANAFNDATTALTLQKPDKNWVTI